MPDLIEYDTYNAVMTSPYHYQVKPPLCIIGEVNFASNITTQIRQWKIVVYTMNSCDLLNFNTTDGFKDPI